MMLGRFDAVQSDGFGNLLCLRKDESSGVICWVLLFYVTKFGKAVAVWLRFA